MQHPKKRKGLQAEWVLTENVMPAEISSHRRVLATKWPFLHWTMMTDHWNLVTEYFPPSIFLKPVSFWNFHIEKSRLLRGKTGSTNLKATAWKARMRKKKWMQQSQKVRWQQSGSLLCLPLEGTVSLENHDTRDLTPRKTRLEEKRVWPGTRLTLLAEQAWASPPF